jgi:hypothetical protein
MQFSSLPLSGPRYTTPLFLSFKLGVSQKFQILERGVGFTDGDIISCLIRIIVVIIVDQLFCLSLIPFFIILNDLIYALKFNVDFSLWEILVH